MIILGIDPGFASLGYGVICADKTSVRVLNYGVIKSAANLSMHERLYIIYKKISALIKKIKPDLAAVEELFFYKNQKTALLVSQARGVILLALHQAKIPISEFTPLEVKQALTSYGRADKRQMQKMLQLRLALKKLPTPDDAADALAIALCAHQTKTYGL